MSVLQIPGAFQSGYPWKLDEGVVGSRNMGDVAKFTESQLSLAYFRGGQWCDLQVALETVNSHGFQKPFIKE